MPEGFRGTQILHIDEPIYAWRSWRVGIDPWGRPRLLPAGLTSIGSELSPWTPGKAGRAIHWDDGNPTFNHDAPATYCNCGYWAFKSARYLHLHSSYHNQGYILGRVAMWGNIVEGTLGYRGEFVYPDHLWTTEHLESEWRLSRSFFERGKGRGNMIEDLLPKRDDLQFMLRRSYQIEVDKRPVERGLGCWIRSLMAQGIEVDELGIKSPQ